MYDPSSWSSLTLADWLRRTVDWLPSVLLAVGRAKRGSQLLAVWGVAYVSRTLFPWHDPLPLELVFFFFGFGCASWISEESLRFLSVCWLATRAEDFFFGFSCANWTLEESLSFLSLCWLADWIQGDMMDFYFMLSYSPDFLSLYLFPYCYRGRKPSWKHISKQCLPLTLLHFVCS